MSRMTKTDIVAATFRNAMFDASGMNLFEIEEREYDRFDAQILEKCYKALDVMPQENLDTYAQCISLGFQVNYDIEQEDFIVIVE